MKNWLSWVSVVIRFVQYDIWRTRVKDLTRFKGFLIRNTRVVVIAIKEFIEDRCTLRASALTFYSLLSIVPMVAMAFAIAKGFGFQNHLEDQLLEKFSGQEQVILQVIDFSRNMLENTKGGIIAGVGVAVLLWAVMRILSQIEFSLNDIWRIKAARSFGRKFSDYLSIMLIAPVLLIMSSSVTVMVATQLSQITEKIALLGVFSPLISLVIEILPYGLIWILFAFLYLFMPNARINYASGLIAGIAAGTIFVIVQKIYIVFQVGVAQYNAIYGSFAALPLFLVWLQLSWLIVLFGAELSCAHQNVEAYDFEPDRKDMSLSFRKLLSVQVIHLLVTQFMRGEAPMTIRTISYRLEMPIRLVQEIVSNLSECGLVSQTAPKDGENIACQPARDINELTVASIIEAMENKGGDAIPVAKTEAFLDLSETLREFNAAIERSPANRLLKDI
ncbi:MAG: YihY/virulence factor BrkB family protein [Desulfobacterales bacterium]|nr:YihY/virulence factor BrkB family protein [Desulfobacterales bacterium]